MTENIMSDMSSDVVNSIDDTDESRQVASIIRDVYTAMVSNRNWPHLKRPIQIVASGDSALPTHMTLQDEITEMVFLNYNKVKVNETRKRYDPVRWLEPEQFLRKINPLNNDDSNIDVIIDPSGIELNIRNDIAPTHYTSFDDDTLVFNSYDNTVDATLQTSKIQAHAYVAPTWVHLDEAIPDLPDEAFSALLEKSKAAATLKLNQTQDITAENEAGRQQRWLSRKAWRSKGGTIYPNYGRKSTKMHRDPTFRQDRV